MNSPLIHIGYPKSGSTWFQKNFYPNVKNGLFIPRKEIQEYIIRPYAIDYNPARAIQHFQNGKDTRILICEELLLASVRSGGFNGFVIKEIGERLKSTFPEAKIIIFIRNQVDMIASAYGQYIRDGGRAGINEYLFHPRARFYVDLSLFSFQYLEYDRILGFYKKLFGDNVFIYTFEEFIMDRTKFLESFSTTFELKVDIENLDQSHVNKRLNSPAYIKWRNRFRIPGKISLSRISGSRLNHEIIFRKRNSPEDILGEENTRYIKEYYSESNRRLVDEHKMDRILSLGYPV